MKTSIFLSIVIFILLFSCASTYGGNFGLGVILGEPTGICFKNWTSGSGAIDGAMAWSLGKHGSLHLHADYLLHNFSTIKVNRGQMPFYIGIGGRIKFIDDNKDDQVGVRIPIGLAYIFPTVSLDIFMEIVPILDLLPDSELDWNGAIGIRYFF